MLSSPWCCSSRLWAQISLPLSPAAVPCRRSAPWSVLQTPKQQREKTEMGKHHTILGIQLLLAACSGRRMKSNQWEQLPQLFFKALFLCQNISFALCLGFLHTDKRILTKDICSGSTTFTITAWANCQSSSRPKTHTVFWCSCFLKHTFDSESLRGILSYTYRYHKQSSEGEAVAWEGFKTFVPVILV